MCSTLKVVGPQNTRFNTILKIVGDTFLMKIIDNSPPLMPHPTDTESNTESVGWGVNGQDGNWKNGPFSIFELV